MNASDWLSTTDGLFDSVERYADFWFGRRDVRDVFAFLLGHRATRLRDPAGLTPDDLRIDAFQDWLLSNYCGPDESWAAALEQRAGSSDAAFRLFSDLYRQYGSGDRGPPDEDDSLAVVLNPRPSNQE